MTLVNQDRPSPELGFNDPVTLVTQEYVVSEAEELGLRRALAMLEYVLGAPYKNDRTLHVTFMANYPDHPHDKKGHDTFVNVMGFEEDSIDLEKDSLSEVYRNADVAITRQVIPVHGLGGDLPTDAAYVTYFAHKASELHRNNPPKMD